MVRDITAPPFRRDRYGTADNGAHRYGAGTFRR